MSSDIVLSNSNTTRKIRLVCRFKLFCSGHFRPIRRFFRLLFRLFSLGLIFHRGTYTIDINDFAIDKAPTPASTR